MGRVSAVCCSRHSSGPRPEHGIWTIQTSVLEANAASIALHEAVGFRVVGRRERIARLDGAWRDTLLLELRLP